MNRFKLMSCASGLILALLVGKSALAQQVYSSSQNVSSKITDGSTPTSVQINSSAQVGLLNSANSYSGGTSVSGGATVLVNSDAQLGNSKGALTLGDGTTCGILGLTNTTGSFVSARSIILNSGNGTIFSPANSYFSGPITGSGGLTLNGGGWVNFWMPGNNFTGGLTVAGGTSLIYSSDAQLGNGSGSVNLGDSTLPGTLAVQQGVGSFTSARAININDGGGALTGAGGNNVTTYSGVISGAGELAINGGTVALTNSGNTYTGGTAIIGGATLQVQADGALGNSLATTVQLGDEKSKGTLQFVSGLGAANSLSRAFVLGSGGGEIINNSGYTLTIGGTIANNLSTSTGGLTVAGNNPIAVTGTGLYSGSLTVAPSSTLILSADYALGGYTVNTSTLTGATSYNLATNPAPLILGSNSTLQLGGNFTVLHPITLNGSATVDVNGNTATVNTAISDGSASKSSLTVTNTSNSSGGSLVLDGVNSYTGGTTVSGGAKIAALVVGDSTHPTAVLNSSVTVESGGVVAGYGTIAGALINQGGTVAPAAVLKAQSYVQTSGSLAPIITPDTAQYSAGGKALIDVGNGNATISGGSLAPAFSTGFLKAGKYLIFQAGSITGAGFAEQTITVPSIGLTGQIVQSGDQYFVVLTQLVNLPSYDRPTVIPVLTNAALDQGQQAIGTLLDRLAGARTNALADELSVALTESHKVRGTSPYGLWIMPLGNNGSVTGSNGVAGYNVQGGGLMAGIDTEWTRGVSIGMALGYTNNFVKQGDGNSGSISMPRLAVYGGWWRGAFAIDGVIGVGMGQIDATRPVAAPSIFQTAYSNHVANEKSAALQASAAFAFDGWVVGPALGAKYLNLRQTSFSETGTDLYNFTVNSQSANSVRPYANLLLTKRFMVSDHWALEPELKVGIEHELSSSVRRVTVSSEGDAYFWTYNGLLTGTDLLRVDGGLKLETSRDAAFFVDYNHLQSSSSTNQYVSGGFRYRL